MLTSLKQLYHILIFTSGHIIVMVHVQGGARIADILKYLAKTILIGGFDKRLWTLFLKYLEGIISLQNMFNMTIILSDNLLESNTNVCDDITTQVSCNLATQLDSCYSSPWGLQVLGMPSPSGNPIKRSFMVPSQSWGVAKHNLSCDDQDKGVSWCMHRKYCAGNPILY
jgi:hypothetical protein